jgi:hypothetical protein
MSEVRNVATFHNPLFAIRNGQQPIKILAVGDETGKSPVYLTVDEQGKSTWQSVMECTIIDFQALPYNAELLRTLAQARR